MAQTVHRQFGSKVRLAGDIIRLIPAGCRVWVEGFAGSAAVTLAKPPHRFENLNDKDGEIVNLFRVIRDREMCAELAELIALTPYAQQEFAEACLAEAGAAGPVERARLFLVRSWMSIGAPTANNRLSWSAGWRSSSKANSPVPHVWQRVPARILAAADRLKHATIHCADIRDIVARFGPMPDSCLFLDPPYPNSAIDTKARPYAVDMTEEEHAALAEDLRGVAGAVILTMAEDTVYDQVLQDWHRTTVAVRGLVNSVKSEVIYTNFRPAGDLFAEAG